MERVGQYGPGVRGELQELGLEELQLAEFTPGAAIARLIQHYTRYIVNTGASGYLPEI